MKKIVYLTFIMSFVVLSCKTAKQKRCEEFINREPLKIKSYEELISYEKNEQREVSLLVLDAQVANEELLEKLVFNNSDVSIIEVKSVISADGSYFDGEPKRVILITSNMCEKWKIKKGELIIK